MGGATPGPDPDPVPSAPLPGVVRVSLGIENSEEDVDTLIQVLGNIARQPKSRCPGKDSRSSWTNSPRLRPRESTADRKGAYREEGVTALLVAALVSITATAQEHVPGWGLSAVVAVGVVVVLAGTSLAQSGNSSLGTWKLRGAMPNVGAGSPTSVILTYEAAGTGIKATLDVMGANGALAHLEFSGDYDGKDNPVTGNQVGDTVALTRLDANTVRLVHKWDGKVTLTETAVVSGDGKTMTVTNTNAQGNPVEGAAIWDKQ